MLKGLWKEATQAYDRYRMHTQAVLGFLAILALIRFVPDSWLQVSWILNTLTVRVLLGTILVLFSLILFFFFQIRCLRAELALNDLPKETLEQKS